MTTFMQTTLGAIADFVNGGAWSADEYCGDGVPVVRVSDIRDETIDLSDCKFLPKDAFQKYERHVLATGDLVICTVGSHPTQPDSVVGRAAIVPPACHGALLNQNAVRIRPRSTHVDRAWLGYLGRSKKFHDYIVSCARGSANQVRMAIGLLKEMPVDVPPLELQRRVVHTLEAYDALIENGLRRIVILEGMARLVYREWFTEGRISPLADSSQLKVWPQRSLAELIADHVGGGWGAEWRDDQFSEVAWVIRGTDIPGAQHCDVTKVPRRFHKASNLSRRRLEPNDIVFEVSGGSKGQPVGRCLLITPELLSAFAGEPVMCASFCKRVRPNADAFAPELLYLSLLEAYDSGETLPFQIQSTGISNFKWMEFLDQRTCVVPPKQLQERFRQIVGPMISAIAVLGLQVSTLRRMRDLLIPRLISGELGVGGNGLTQESASETQANTG
jgi:type I restriction enzyme S subunit